MTTPAPQVWPSVSARDPRALIAFLADVAGFRETVVYADDDGVVAHAEIAGPAGGGIMLGAARPDDAGRVAGPGQLTAYVVLPDAAAVDAVAARAHAAGAEVTREPYDTDYGSHDTAIRDPEGNHWQFGTYPGHPVGG